MLWVSDEFQLNCSHPTWCINPPPPPPSMPKNWIKEMKPQWNKSDRTDHSFPWIVSQKPTIFSILSTWWTIPLNIPAIVEDEVLMSRLLVGCSTSVSNYYSQCESNISRSAEFKRKSYRSLVIPNRFYGGFWFPILQSNNLYSLTPRPQLCLFLISLRLLLFGLPYRCFVAWSLSRQVEYCIYPRIDK